MITSALAAETGAGGGKFPPFDPSTFGSQLFWLAVAFTVLYVVMARVALPRVENILSERRSRIARDLKDSAVMQKRAEEAGAAYEEALAKARADAQQIAAEARARSAQAADQRRQALEAELAGKLLAAEGQIAATKASAMAGVDGIAAEAAALIVERLTGIRPAVETVNDALPERVLA